MRRIHTEPGNHYLRARADLSSFYKKQKCSVWGGVRKSKNPSSFVTNTNWTLSQLITLKMAINNVDGRYEFLSGTCFLSIYSQILGAGCLAVKVLQWHIHTLLIKSCFSLAVY